MATASTSEQAPAAAPTRLEAPAPAIYGALTVLAALLRLPTLAQQSFWLDEAYTERLVRMSFGGMLHAIPRTESTPPVYYALAWVWTRVFTHSEFGLRSLSALAGIATVPVVCMVAHRLGGRRAAVIAGLLVATSPVMVWFSQEARAYALATLEATGALLGLVAYLQTRRTAWLAGWAACASLGLATHYFTAFVVAPEVAWLAWSERQRISRRLVVAVGVVAAVAIALVPLALAQRGTGNADYIAQGSLATRVAQLPKQMLIGYASPGQLLTALLAAALVVVGAGAPLLARRDVRERAIAPLMVGVAAVIVPIVLAVVGIDFLNTRNVLVALPALVLGVAVALGDRFHRRLGWTCAGLLAVVGVIVVVLVDTHPQYQRDDWRGVSRALGVATGTRAIVVSPGSGLVALEAYQGGLRAMTAPVAVTELDVALIPGQVTGGGIGALPPRSATVPAPHGFTPLAPVRGATYVVLRFRAPSPTVVPPSIALTDHLGTGSVAPLVQVPAHR